jgi:hypothetical protein
VQYATDSLVPTCGTHGFLSWRKGRDLTNNKTALTGGSWSGSDGTRTRDLRRDRPALDVWNAENTEDWRDVNAVNTGFLELFDAQCDAQFLVMPK